MTSWCCGTPWSWSNRTWSPTRRCLSKWRPLSLCRRWSATRNKVRQRLIYNMGEQNWPYTPLTYKIRISKVSCFSQLSFIFRVIYFQMCFSFLYGFYWRSRSVGYCELLGWCKWLNRNDDAFNSSESESRGLQSFHWSVFSIQPRLWNLPLVSPHGIMEIW